MYADETRGWSETCSGLLEEMRVEFGEDVSCFCQFWDRAFGFLFSSLVRSIALLYAPQYESVKRGKGTV